LVLGDQEEMLVTLVQEDLLEILAHRELLAKLESGVKMAARDCKEIQAYQVWLETGDQREPLEALVCKELLDSEG